MVKSIARTRDLSGTGAFRAGGRWNDRGTYVLYTSENSSLAFLENLVHVGVPDLPGGLFIVEIEFEDKLPVFTLPEASYPSDWKEVDNLPCKQVGDAFFANHEYFALKVRSAVNPIEYNFLLNPLFPGFQTLVQITQVVEVPVDGRLK